MVEGYPDKLGDNLTDIY